MENDITNEKSSKNTVQTEETSKIHLKSTESIHLTDKNSLPYNVGSRALNDDQIGHLKYVTKPIYEGILPYETMDKAFKKIAEILLKADITFESALKYFESVGKYTNILIKVYNNPIPDENIYPLHEILYNSPDGSLSPNDAKKIENAIISTIQEDLLKETIKAQIENNVSIISDSIQKEIIQQKNKYYSNTLVSEDITIVKACLKELVVYDNPLSEEPRRFKATFESKIRDRPIIIGPMLIDDIINYLISSGYVERLRLVKDTIPSIFNAFIEANKATIKNEIENPGFFYDSEKDSIIVVDYEIKDIKTEDLKSALELLEKFARWFQNQKTKLATVFKWGLIAPFIFAMKQKGKWVEMHFLHGKAGSGKTTMGEMVLYLWGEPDTRTNDLGGSSFNTEARIGYKISQSTFPIVVNEPGSLFEKAGVVDLIKTAIENTHCRGRFEGSNFKDITALAPFMFTSNRPLPSDDALMRRSDPIGFFHDEKKTEDEKKAFINEFKMNDKKNCLLNELKPTANFVANKIIENPSLLDKNWRDLSNEMIRLMYKHIGMNTPEWLLQWSETETLEDLEGYNIEHIRIFLQNEINRAYDNRIQVVDEYRMPVKKYNNEYEIKKGSEFGERIHAVANEREIPWILINKKYEVILTTGFIEALKNKTGISETLKGISQLLGWKYTNSRVREQRIAQRLIKVDFETFVSFVFPNIDD